MHEKVLNLFNHLRCVSQSHNDKESWYQKGRQVQVSLMVCRNMNYAAGKKVNAAASQPEKSLAVSH